MVSAILVAMAATVTAAMPAGGVGRPPAGFTLQEGKPHHLRLGSEGAGPWAEVAVWFDGFGLHIDADVHDTHCRDGFRSWRHGDGFTLNVVLPEAGDAVDSRRFDAFGFGLEAGRPVAVAINRDGRYLLAPEPEIGLEIHCDPEAGPIHYRVTIPWHVLPRVRPLLDRSLGLNIVYISQHEDGSRTILPLVEDPHYDTELTPRRRFVPVGLEPGEDSDLSITGALEHRLVRRHQLSGAVVIHVPDALTAELELEVADSQGRPVVSRRQPLQLTQGTHRLELDLRLPRSLSGLATITARVGPGPAWGDHFLVVFERELERFSRSLTELERSAADPLTAASVRGLQLRWLELEKALASLGPRDDPAMPAAELSRLQEAAERHRRPGALPPASGLLRAAFRSSLDGSLQPLTLYLPEGFDATRPVSVIVALHGSGVDEMGTAAAVGQAWARGSVLVVAPRGRGLSDWWVGASEQDVLDALAAVGGLVRVERAVLYGFSMGGYGAARLLLRHPDSFAGAAVISGGPVNLRTRAPEDDLRNLVLPGTPRPVLWLHGSEDRSLPVAEAEELIGRLRQAGWPVEYVRLEGAGHGDFRVAPHITPWLERVLYGDLESGPEPKR